MSNEEQLVSESTSVGRVAAWINQQKSSKFIGIERWWQPVLTILGAVATVAAEPVHGGLELQSPSFLHVSKLFTIYAVVMLATPTTSSHRVATRSALIFSWARGCWLTMQPVYNIPAHHRGAGASTQAFFNQPAPQLGSPAPTSGGLPAGGTQRWPQQQLSPVTGTNADDLEFDSLTTEIWTGVGDMGGSDSPPNNPGGARGMPEGLVQHGVALPNGA